MGGQTCHDLAVTSYIFISRSILVLQKSSVHSDVISHNKNIHNFGYTKVCREYSLIEKIPCSIQQLFFKIRIV